MSSTQSLQGVSSNAMSAAAEARRAAYARSQAATENEVRPQESGEVARLAAERNDDFGERIIRQRQTERQTDLEAPGKTGRNLDFMA